MQNTDQIKTDAINDFVSQMIGALEAGFIDDNELTLAELHRVAQNYIYDKFGINMPTLEDQWGKEVAFMCGNKG